MKKYNTLLKSIAIQEGISLFGVAYIRDIKNEFLLPKELINKFDYAISIGYRLSDSILKTLVDEPNHTYYFHYQRVNILLDQTSLKIVSIIQTNLFDAFPVPASQIIDWQKSCGHLSHKKIAFLAGLGWIGRNNLLVNSIYGSKVRYATILTNMSLLADKPILQPTWSEKENISFSFFQMMREMCENCKKCIERCPAGAIKENSFNLELCKTKLKEFQKTRNIGQMICGLCLCDGVRS